MAGHHINHIDIADAAEFQAIYDFQAKCDQAAAETMAMLAMLSDDSLRSLWNAAQREAMEARGWKRMPGDFE